MLLNFFVARLKNNDPKSKATEVLLRFRATDDAEDLTSNEPALASFCFPLGPESITPKEYMASEVGALRSWRRTPAINHTLFGYIVIQA